MRGVEANLQACRDQLGECKRGHTRLPQQLPDLLGDLVVFLTEVSNEGEMCTGWEEEGR